MDEIVINKYKIRVVDTKASIYVVEGENMDHAIERLNDAIVNKKRSEPIHLINRTYDCLEVNGVV